MHLNKEY